MEKLEPKDIIFIGNLEVSMFFDFYEALFEAYKKGVTITLVYPVDAAMRTLTNGNTFIYVNDNTSNYDRMIESNNVSFDVLSTPEESVNLKSEVGTVLTKEEIKAELNSSRVDDRIQSTTAQEADKPDSVSWSFIEYYNKFGKNNDNFKRFADKCDFDNERLLNKYWSDFKVSRKTFSQYQVISLHSFTDHNDYYLVISRANTQPQSIVIADEVSGKYTFGNYVHYIPDRRKQTARTALEQVM